MNKETKIDFRTLRFAAFYLLEQARSGSERSKHLAEALRNAKHEDAAKAVESARNAFDDATKELDKACETLNRNGKETTE